MIRRFPAGSHICETISPTTSTTMASDDIFEKRKILARQTHDHGSGNNQKAHQHDCQHAHDDEAEALRTGDIPGPRIRNPVGPVERQTQRLDAVGGKQRCREHGDRDQSPAIHRQHLHHLTRNGLGNVLRPSVEDHVGNRFGVGAGAEKTCKRRTEDDERKQCKQHRHGDMARHRPAVIHGEVIDRVPQDRAHALASFHRPSSPFGAILNQIRYHIPNGIRRPNRKGQLICTIEPLRKLY